MRCRENKTESSSIQSLIYSYFYIENVLIEGANNKKDSQISIRVQKKKPCLPDPSLHPYHAEYLFNIV